ncbi:hypothetical protein [Pseudonocardia endophytica]|uniref:Ferric iron reductase FhuF-like transporter n=1 Tax=Pseudonocardia endophytica TaxID=401976 RepID=A0A4R1I458_PSEEN|nr:hypothetical protein [Pseudonocardia endophytica]TCK24802.1 ferric iron reductase FhuF-like transporter [Pseudonocardia endophytica]
MTSASADARIAERFAPVVVTDEPGWVDAESVLSSGEPTRIEAMLAGPRRSSRARTDTAAGSLLLLEYARLLSWPVLAARLRDGADLDPSPANVALRPGDLERGALAFRRGPTTRRTSRDPDATREDAPAVPGELDDVVTGLVDHLERLGDALSRHVRIGRRTVLGDIASALAGGFLALSWMHPPRDRHLPVALDAVESDPRLRGLVSLEAVEHEGRPWMVAWRTACCLASGDPAARSYCGTCPVLDKDERLERFHHAAGRYLGLTGTSSPSTR